MIDNNKRAIFPYRIDYVYAFTFKTVQRCRAYLHIIALFEKHSKRVSI